MFNQMKNCSFLHPYFLLLKSFCLRSNIKHSTMFYDQMKHLRVCQKYCAAHDIFDSLLSVSYGDETLCLMLDILLLKFPRSYIDPGGGGGERQQHQNHLLKVGPKLVILALGFTLFEGQDLGFKSNMVRFGIKSVLGMRDA